jgi:hypothetical protein
VHSTPSAGTVTLVLPWPPQSITAPGIESETSTPVTAMSLSFEIVIVPFTVNVCTCECVTVTFHVTEPFPPSGRFRTVLSPYSESGAPAGLTCLSTAQLCVICDAPLADFSTERCGVGASFGSKQNSTWLICGAWPPLLVGGIRNWSEVADPS